MVDGGRLAEVIGQLRGRDDRRVRRCRFHDAGEFCPAGTGRRPGPHGACVVSGRAGRRDPTGAGAGGGRGLAPGRGGRGRIRRRALPRQSGQPVLFLQIQPLCGAREAVRRRRAVRYQHRRPERLPSRASGGRARTTFAIPMWKPGSQRPGCARSPGGWACRSSPTCRHRRACPAAWRPAFASKRRRCG